jgi:hypothetical protein
MFGTGPIRLIMLSLRRAYLRAESGGGHLATTADRIDYWVRRHIVPCPPQKNVNPARDRLVALAAIARGLRISTMPSRLPSRGISLHSSINSKRKRSLFGQHRPRVAAQCELVHTERAAQAL